MWAWELVYMVSLVTSLNWSSSSCCGLIGPFVLFNIFLCICKFLVQLLFHLLYDEVVCLLLLLICLSAVFTWVKHNCTLRMSKN